MTAPVLRPHHRTGRKLKDPPAGAAERIQELAADGFSLRGVAAGLVTSADTLRRWMTEDPELQEAFDRGREVERHALHNLLFKQATEKGNVAAAMFLLKSRHGYREGDQGDFGNRVNITFNLPAALPLADYQVIEHAGGNDRAEQLPSSGLTRA